MTRHWVALGVLLVGMAVGACGTEDASGRVRLDDREELDACAAWLLIDGIDEPAIDDGTALGRWATDIRIVVEAIDADLEIDDEAVPAGVVDAFGVIDAELASFRAALDDGGADARSTVASLARGPFSTANDEVAIWARSRC